MFPRLFLSRLSSLPSFSFPSSSFRGYHCSNKKRELVVNDFLKDDGSLLRRLPKAELHSHLDGCLRLPTLIELSRDCGQELPAYTEDGLMETTFKEHYNDLPEYLECFKYTAGAMQTPDALERVAYEMAEDAWKQGIRYLEVRYAPHLHCNDIMDEIQVMDAVNLGLEKATVHINSVLKKQSNDQGPEFKYGVLACFLRSISDPQGNGFSSYYDFLVKKGQKPEHGSMNLMKAIQKMKHREEYIEREKPFPIVGVDLAGAEAGFPCSPHSPAFHFSSRLLLSNTVHAGEAWGPESIYQALTKLHARRIGHGFNIFNSHKIKADWSQKRKEGYVHDIVQYIKRHKIHLEVCLTSNLQTLPELEQKMHNHPFREMLDSGLMTSLCVDSTLVSRTDINKEYTLALKNLNLSPTELKNNMINSFDSCFYHFLEHHHRLEYIESVKKYYDVVVDDYLNTEQP